MANLGGLTPGEAEVIKDGFSLFDKNGDGTICKEELGSVLHALGQIPTQKTIDQYMADADIDGSGNLCYKEFVRLVEKDMLTPAEIKVQLEQAFRVFDKNADGFLDKRELFRVLTKIGECLTEDEAEEILNLADTSGDGKLNVKEFVDFLYDRV